MIMLIDSHAHLDMPHFDADRDAVIARAQEAGVSAILTLGVDGASSQRANGGFDPPQGGARPPDAPTIRPF